MLSRSTCRFDSAVFPTAAVSNLSDTPGSRTDHNSSISWFRSMCRNPVHSLYRRFSVQRNLLLYQRLFLHTTVSAFPDFHIPNHSSTWNFPFFHRTGRAKNDLTRPIPCYTVSVSCPSACCRRYRILLCAFLWQASQQYFTSFLVVVNAFPQFPQTHSRFLLSAASCR